MTSLSSFHILNLGIWAVLLGPKTLAISCPSLMKFIGMYKFWKVVWVVCMRQLNYFNILTLWSFDICILPWKGRCFHSLHVVLPTEPVCQSVLWMQTPWFCSSDISYMAYIRLRSWSRHSAVNVFLRMASCKPFLKRLLLHFLAFPRLSMLPTDIICLNYL